MWLQSRVGLTLGVGRETSSDPDSAAPQPPSLSRSMSDELVEHSIAEAGRARDEAMAAIQAEHGMHDCFALSLIHLSSACISTPDHSIAALVAEYDAYLASAMPSASLLPVR